MGKTKVKLEIKQRTNYSAEFKKDKVKDLIKKRISIKEVMNLYQVSRTSVYKWIYRYSADHERKPILVVQMESEAAKTKLLLQRVAELERIVGQKQLEIDFLSKLIEIGSEELGFDLKKNFSPSPSNGTAVTKKDTDTK